MIFQLTYQKLNERIDYRKKKCLDNASLKVENFVSANSSAITTIIFPVMILKYGTNKIT